MLPESFVTGYGVGVSGQHQAAGTGAEGGDKVGFARIVKGHDFGGKTEVVEPVGEDVDDFPVALIDIGVNTANGVAGNQRL